MIRAYLKTRVEVLRNGQKVMDTKVLVKEDEIWFEDVDIRELDILRVIGAGLEYRIQSVYSQLGGNRVLFKKARYVKVI